MTAICDRFWAPGWEGDAHGTCSFGKLVVVNCCFSSSTVSAGPGLRWIMERQFGQTGTKSATGLT